MELKNNNRGWLKPSESLSQRTIRGGIWVFAIRIASRLFGLVRTVILARLLAPKDFGLMGIALLAIATLDTLSQTGFNIALIQKKRNTEEYLDTAWTVQVIRGIVLCGILLAAAPLLAAFFDTPKAAAIIRVIAVAELIKSITNIGVVYFQKELEFNKMFVYQLSATVADLSVAISAALILRSVWALVFGLLARHFVSCIISYVIHPFRPRVKMDLRKSRELFDFGKWIFVSSILLFLITKGDDIFVGKLLGVTALGLYQMAYMLSNLPATEITHVISRVTFPAYSKLQDDLPKLREAYIKVLQLTAFISIPIAGGIFVLAPDFTQIFLGGKWMPIVPTMQALCIFGAIRSINATLGPIFEGVGKPEISTKLQFIQLILLAILIYPLSIRWGMLGVSLALIFSILIAGLVGYYIVIKTTKCSTRNFCKMIVLPLINTPIMVSSILLLKIYWTNSVGIPEFFLFVGIGVLIYFGMTYLFDRFFGYGIRTTVKESLASF